MKRYTTTTAVIALLSSLLLSGCKGFLDEYSQDTIVPTTAKDYSEILYGDAYFKEVTLPYRYLDLLTDDVVTMVNANSTQGDDQRRTGYGYYTWQDNPELSPTNVLNTDLTWLTLYEHILSANIILDAIDEMEGTTEEKAQLEGEAHAIRLFAYFMLTNIYGEPYDPATASTAVGVPLNYHHYAEDVSFPRATIAEDYAEMEKDIQGADEAFAKVSDERNIFRWNHAAIAVLASRVYLHMQQWDKVIEYADLALSLNGALRDLNTLPAPGSDEAKNFICKDNKEINYSYGFGIIPELSNVHPYYFGPSDGLMSSFGEGDLRYNGENGYFINTTKENVGGWLFPKWVTTIKIVKTDMSEITGLYGFAIRSAEAYLNRAEAYAMKGDLSRAMKDLNTLRRARVTPEYAALETPGTQEEVVRLIWQERRREFCFEQLRWFDLRRQGMPELHHTYITGTDKETGTEEYTLPAKSPKYVLPVPHTVRISDAVLGGGKATK